MKVFEDLRNDFNGTNYDRAPLQLNMKDLQEGDPNCIQYDPEDGEITLTSSVPCSQATTVRLTQNTSKDLRACFDPVISSITGLIEEQKGAVAKDGGPAIKVSR